MEEPCIEESILKKINILENIDGVLQYYRIRSAPNSCIYEYNYIMDCEAPEYGIN